MADATILGYVRPLSIWELDDQLPVNVSHAPGDLALRIIGGMFESDGDPFETVRLRYKRVCTECNEPFLVPHHPNIMHYVIRPLQEAKRCYVLGMPVACIAQAGFVGEMVALWRFRMLETKVDGRPLDVELQKALLGREFDKLGQEERVRVLRALEVMDEETVQAFGELRSLRRQYLHFMVDPQRDTDSDALRALRYANVLVQKTLNATIHQGVVILPPRVAKYVEEIIEYPQPVDRATGETDGI
jgi:hypothetical protein